MHSPERELFILVIKMTYPIKKVSDCLEKLPKKGGVPKKEYKREGKFPVIDQGQNFISGYTDSERLVYSDIPVIIFGDHTRAFKYADLPFVVGADGTQVLKPTADIFPKYFYYVLKSLDIKSRGYARHFKILKEKEIPLPSLAEQKKIVAKLEKVLAKMHEAKKLRAQAQEATNQLLPAELHKVFEEGKKEGWEEKQLGEISEIARGGSPRPISAYITDKPSGINWIKIGDATRSNKYITNTRQKIKPEGLKKSRQVGDGDLLLSNSMSFGHPYIMKTTGAIHDGWLVIKPDHKKVDEEYLYQAFGTPQTISFIEGLAGGAVVKNLNIDRVKTIPILLPPLTEQKKIIARLDSISEKVKALRERQQAQLKDLEALEQSILSKAFAGEFV